MKNAIQSIRIRTVTAVKVVAIAAVMYSAVPAVTSTSVASAQATSIPELAIWIGPLRLCLFYCFFPGYCCEVKGQL